MLKDLCQEYLGQAQKVNEREAFYKALNKNVMRDLAKQARTGIRKLKIIKTDEFSDVTEEDLEIVLESFKYDKNTLEDGTIVYHIDLEQSILTGNKIASAFMQAAIKYDYMRLCCLSAAGEGKSTVDFGKGINITSEEIGFFAVDEGLKVTQKSDDSTKEVILN